MNADPQSPLPESDRLIGAADVLLAARSRGEGAEAFVDAWLGHGAKGAQPRALYTYEELVEAMCFLIRCGLVVPHGPEARRARRSA